MALDLLPHAGPDDVSGLTDPLEVVEAFLHALAAPDLHRALALVDPDITYVNVGLPTIQGKRRVAKVLGGLDRPGASFEVYLHASSADGTTVLTERTDALVFGRFRTQFWVWGRFEVVDGRITLWRDSFDFLDIAKASVRGLVGLALPRLRPAPPTSPDVPPGRS